MDPTDFLLHLPAGPASDAVVFERCRRLVVPWVGTCCSSTFWPCGSGRRQTLHGGGVSIGFVVRVLDTSSLLYLCHSGQRRAWGASRNKRGASLCAFQGWGGRGRRRRRRGVVWCRRCVRAFDDFGGTATGGEASASACAITTIGGNDEHIKRLSFVVTHLGDNLCVTVDVNYEHF